MKRKFTGLFILIFFLAAFAVQASAQLTGPPENYEQYDTSNEGFAFMYANVFDTQRNPSISVFCNKEDVPWDGGCPGPDQTVDDTILTNDAQMEICGETVPVRIEDDGPDYRVYDPGSQDYYANTILNSINSCEYGYNGDYTFKKSDGSNSVTGGKVYVARTAASNLVVNMNTAALVFDPEGSEGDLIGFKLVEDFKNEGQKGIAINEYDSNGPQYEILEPKKNYVWKLEDKAVNAFLKNPFKGDCEGDPICNIAQTQFTGDTDEVDVRSCQDNGKSNHCPLGYDLASRWVTYQPGGSDFQAEVIYGKEYGGEYDSMPSESSAENKFHLCHEGITNPYRKKTVYSPGTNMDYNQFICQDDGSWENIATCSDNLDNNGNDETDLDDTICDNNPDQTEADIDCDQSVVAYDENGVKANFGLPYMGISETVYSPRDGSLYAGCEYSTKNTELDYDVDNNDPVKFECVKNGENIESSGYDGPTDQEAEDFCQLLSDFNSHGGSIESVQYFVPKEAIPTGPEWATSTGFKSNEGFQSVHMAEYEYVDNAFDSTPHLESTWENKDMINTDAYESEPIQDTDAWKVANAGATTDDVYSDNVGDEEKSRNNEDVFDGGFAGNCKSTEKWVNNGAGWRCDIVADTQTIEVNAFDLEVTEVAGSYAGLHIEGSQREKWAVATGVDPDGQTGANRLIFLAECWHGGASGADMPPKDQRIRMSTDYEPGSGDAYLIGKIPERTDGGPSQFTEKQYACTFGMRQKITDKTSLELPDDVRLYENGGEPSGDSGYIVEGTDGWGRVSTETGSKNVPYPDDWDDQNTEPFYEEPGQQWLSEKAGNTNTLNSDQETYAHFPTDGELPPGDGERAGSTNAYDQIRHPTIVLENR